MIRSKRILTLILALTLILVGTAGASAALSLQAQSALLDEGNMLNAVVYTTVEGNLQTEDFSVKLDAAEAKVESVGSYYRSNSGTTYLYLIDTPRAMKNASFTLLKETVAKLIDNLSAYDNAAILTTGGNIANLTLTNGKELLKQALESIEKTTAMDTLNVSIVDALNFLQSAAERNERTCLIVLSTGETRDETGMTQAEMQKVASGLPVTIYTYAFVTDDSDNKRLKQANDFGTIARQSVGGADTLVNSKNTADTLSAVITENEKRFLLLKISAQVPEGTTGSGILSISVKDGNLIFSDDLSLSPDIVAAFKQGSGSNLPGEPTPTGGIEPTSTAAIDPTHDDEQPIIDNYLVYIIAGLGAVLLVLIIALIVVGRRRKRSFEMDDAPSSDLNEPGRQRDGAGITQITEDDIHTEPVVERNAIQAKLRITLTQVGIDVDQQYTADMIQSLIIGRSPREARLVIAKDPTISSTHAKITFDGSAVRLEDMQSSNGTKINGVKIQMPTVLHSGDVLTFGKSSLRITWQRL